MYKVFFNGSSLTLCAEIENSFKDNTHQIVDCKEIGDFMPFVSHLENGDIPENIVFVSSNLKKQWQQFRGQFTEVIAAGGVVVNQRGQMLVIKRLGCWDLPKGKVEKEETIEEAAIREVEEECGISGVRIKKLLGSMFHLYRSPFHAGPNNFVLKETFWYEMEYHGEETPQPQYSENIEEVYWMDRNNMSQFFSNTYPNLAELLRSYLAQTGEKII